MEERIKNLENISSHLINSQGHLIKMQKTLINLLENQIKVTTNLQNKIQEMDAMLNELLRKNMPENPGDINTLYQNWDKH